MVTVLLVAAAAALLFAVRRRRGRQSAQGLSKRSALAFVVGVVALNTLVGSPAMAQDLDCVPNPERPGSGMVGAIDPPLGNGEAGSPYQVYGFAGMVWHVYDESCNGLVPSGVTDPGATIDNWAGNELFNIAKVVVGTTNSLHYTLLDGGILSGLNEQIGEAAKRVFDNLYAQLFSVFALVLAVMMFRQIWRGNLAAVSKRALFAIGGMWFAASSMLIVTNYDRIDETIYRVTTGIQGGFVDPGEDRVAYDILPTQLHNKIVYENWLRGEFGSPDHPEAVQYGPRLLAAQAWTRDDLVEGRDSDDAAEQAKKAEYRAVATELGPTAGQMKGTEGGRVGAGVLSVFQATVYSVFQFIAKAAVLLAQLLLRIVALAAPIIGLVALVHHNILLRVGRALGAVILNVLVLAMLAGVHGKFLELIFSQDAGLSLLTQMLLAAIVTFVFFLIGRPMRRMWQMMEMSAGAAGISVSSPGTGVFSRFRRNKHTGPTPQDTFWEKVREEEDTSEGSVLVQGGGRRPRPEASNPAVGPLTVQAERLDGGGESRTAIVDPRMAIGAAAPRLGPAQPVDAEIVSGVPAPGRSHLVTRSRTADTVPVTDRGWDRGEDAVVVPSRVTGAGEPILVDHGAPAPQPQQPRAADVEVVAGRPVHVVYRPSRGLEVAEQPRRTPRPDTGPLDTDRLVR